MALPTYSSRKLSVAWSGIPFEGLAPDTAVEFSQNADITDEEVGADGLTSISVLPDQSGTVTVTLQQNSPTNIALSGIVNAQRAEGDIYISDLVILDPAGGSIALCSNCHIKTPPSVGFGSTATGQTREWVFYIENVLWQDTPDGVLSDNPVVSQALSLINGAVDFAQSVG